MYRTRKHKHHYKYNYAVNDEFLLYKDNIYKFIKMNDVNIIIMNIKTNSLYSISWGLYLALKHFKKIEEATEQNKLYKNVFVLNQIKTNYNNDDIYNFNLPETPKKIEYTKPNIKHYQELGITALTQYIKC